MIGGSLNHNMKLIRNNTYDNDIVFVDGHGGSGKSLISKVIEAFEGMEISKEDEPFQIIQYIYGLGKIDKNTASVLMKIWADRYLYNQMIGRNVNTRLTDITTLYSYPYPQKYIKRMCDNEHQDVITKINKEKPIFQNMSQNAIIYSDIYFDAFGDRLKIIYIKRNIDDIVDTMMNGEIGERIGNDPTEITPTFLYNENPIPYYAKNWADEYINMSSRERLYRWIEQENKMVDDAYNETKFKDNILFIQFEEFVKKPYKYISTIAEFLDRKPTGKLSEILKREGCPR